MNNKFGIFINAANETKTPISINNLLFDSKYYNEWPMLRFKQSLNADIASRWSLLTENSLTKMPQCMRPISMHKHMYVYMWASVAQHVALIKSTYHMTYVMLCSQLYICCHRMLKLWSLKLWYSALVQELEVEYKLYTFLMHFNLRVCELLLCNFLFSLKQCCAGRRKVARPQSR